MQALGSAVHRVVTVLAVDDQVAFRSALRRVVAASPTLTLAGEAESGEAALLLVNELQPDLVLMDVRMPGIGGISAAREIKRRGHRSIVLLLSTTHPDELPREASDCSADGIVWKGDLRAGLLEQILAAHARRD
jgi:DNA-binding NarL/FixJ family response regulator